MSKDMNPSQNITIIDPQYKSWVQELIQRYRQSQIKAAVKVNQEALLFYWSLGRDIVTLKAERKWGSKLLKNLSEDLKKALPDVGCFSETNLKYMKYFFELYPHAGVICPQLEDKSAATIIRPQVGDKLPFDIFSVPWGHHKLLIDKYKKEPEKALFFVRKTTAMW